MTMKCEWKTKAMRWWLLPALSMVLTGCGTCSRPASIFPADCLLQEGDLVFRMGGGLVSHVVNAADRDGHYSHLGIVVDSANTLMIVHAVPGEPDYKGDPDRVKLSAIDDFYSSQKATRGEVRRLDDTATARRAARHALAVYRRGTLFDHDYDDNDSTRMYCCELVEFVYAAEGVPLVAVPHHIVTLPLAGIDSCRLPSDFCHSPLLKPVAVF